MAVKSRVLIGTCGFSYKDWVGPVYPPGLPERDWLRHYAAEFPMLELNATYYAIPRKESVLAMIQKAEGRTVFVVKLHQDLTHHRDRSEAILPGVLETLALFQRDGALAAGLLQFPHSFHRTPETLAYLDRLVPRLLPHPLVIEFRSREWLHPDTLRWLRDRRIGFCNVDEPRLQGLIPPSAHVTGPVAYLRLHGRNARDWYHRGAAEADKSARYRYDYSDAELREWIPNMRVMARQADTLFVAFNNHPDGHAVLNARRLSQLLAAVPES